MPLLDSVDPPVVTVEAGGDRSPFVFTCDHAGNRLPRALAMLGLDDAALQAHIAWDIGAAALTRLLARRLGATAILQTYSRLAIDCNRPLDAPDSIPARSDQTDIPGNLGLSPAQAQLRAQALFCPYHDRIRRELDARVARQQATLLIAMHSFTPSYAGEPRPWHAGVLYHRDSRLAQPLLAQLRRGDAWAIGDNQPYSMTDATDYTLPEHGERRGLLHAGIEVRQDLLEDPRRQAAWAATLAEALAAVAAQVLVPDQERHARC